jgi:hypothetical protein
MEENKETTSAWLQRLKEESWEAELLVSTISIFGSFQLLSLIDWWTNKFIDILPTSQYFIGYMIVFFGLIAVSTLISMFVIHFILRAYWVGLVGLNSVFPDYSIEDSAYSPIYTEKLVSKLPKLKDSIQKVDDLCSVIFSVAFTFLLMYLYIAVFNSLYLVLYNKLSDYVPQWVLILPIIGIFGLILISTGFSIVGNLKRNRENERIQNLSVKLFKSVSLISYGPLYKSVIQVIMIFGSNFKKRKSFVYLIILFIVCGLIFGVTQMMKTNIPYLIVQETYFDDTRLYPAFYEPNNKTNNFLLGPEISSDIASDDVLKVFIPIFSNEERIEKEVCGTPPSNENLSKVEKKKARRAFYLKCYSDYHSIYLDEKKLELSFIKYEHPRTKQFGLIAYVPIPALAVGNHSLTIQKEANGKMYQSFKVPFYRE